MITSQTNKSCIVFWVSLAGAVLIYGLQLALPGLPVLPVYLPEREVVFLTLPADLHHTLFIAGLFFCLTGVWSARHTPGHPLTPLACLPLTLSGYGYPEIWPVDLAANLLYGGSLGLITWTLYRLANHLPLQVNHPHRWGVGLLLASTLFYTLAGTAISSLVGEHYVDEGHYLIQAESLYQDRDLNIRNNFGFDVDERIRQRRDQLMRDGLSEEEALRQATTQIRSYLHISFRSPDDRWFSWHPYGLSILLAPTMGAPLWIRQLVLGLMGGLGIWFVFLLCLETGRSFRWSLILCLLWAGSILYVVYAVRALPEMLGASLFAGALYGYARALKTPVLAMILIVVCAAIMAVVHPRFIPCAGLVGLGLYARVLIGRRPDRRIVIIYLGSLFIGVLIMAIYLAANHATYSSITAYPLENVFGVYPPGRWLILFSERGLLFSYPASVGLIIGTLYALVMDKKQRGFYTLTALSFGSMVLIMGAVESWDGGPTIHGRYLLVCLPGLIPGAVYLAERAPRLGQLWILFLFLSSVSLTLIGLVNLPVIGSVVLHIPWQALRESLPLLRHLFFPYAVSDIMIGKPYFGHAVFTTNPFPLILLLSSVLIIVPFSGCRRARYITASLGLLVLIASAGWLHGLHGRADRPWSPVELERQLANLPPHVRHLRGTSMTLDDLLVQANRFGLWRPVAFTSQTDAAMPEHYQRFWRHRLGVNDWADRDYRWLTLNRPDHPGYPGPRHTQMSGRVQGDAVLHWAIRQGSHTLLEEQVTITNQSGHFALSRTVHTPARRGHLYYLIRLEGEGTAFIDALVWRPDAQGMMREAAEMPAPD
jgi:hypothetical protein